MTEGKLGFHGISPTAASATNPLFGVSGVQLYRVVLGGGGGGLKAENVDAATGDEAAEMALRLNPGWKVAHVSPATKADIVPAINMGEGE